MRLSKNAMDVNRVGILNSLSTPGTHPSQTGYQLDNAQLSLLRSFLVKRLSFLRLNSMSACKSGSLLILEGMRKETLCSTPRARYRAGDNTFRLLKLMIIFISIVVNPVRLI